MASARNERRNFFRIQDRAVLEYQLADSEHQDFSSLFKLPAQYQLISEFQLLDIEAQSLLRGIYEKDRNLGAYLKVLNRKLDSLSRALALIYDPIDTSKLQNINLSEGGLSFYCDQAFTPGDQLLMKLILMPSYSGLMVSAKILECRPGDGENEIHVEFQNLDEHQRQLIARHILRRQQEERRARDDD